MLRSRLSAGLVVSFAVTASFAVVPPQDGPLRQKELRHSDLFYDNVFRPVAELPLDASRQAAADLSRLGVDPTNAYFDLRTGRWGTVILTQALIPGSGVGNRLSWSDLGRQARPDGAERERAAWEAFRGYLVDNAEALRIDVREFAAPKVQAYGDRVIHIHVGRQHLGIPVRDTFVKATINSGNLVLLSERNWGTLKVDIRPAIVSAQAEESLLRHLEGIPVTGFRKAARLEIVPVSSQAEEALTLLGAGLEHRLVWVLTPTFDGDPVAAWEALVDAHSGELLALQDTAHYASRRVEGWIYPVSNDGVGDDGTLQPGFPLPFADLALDGESVGFSTTGGNAPSGGAEGLLSTELSGRYLTMNDTCGVVDESAAAGDLDLDGIVGGTDCAVPPGHSAGDTNSTRSAFYEINRIQEQARGYLPGNGWLNQTLTANMNIVATCNASWNGSVNFFRSGGGCSNTGELAGVFDHEWGHGMDNNDNTGTISNPGEGIADIYAQNRLNTSCIGRNFRPGVQCQGYGDGCLDCTGIRDTDWAKRVSGQPHDIAWIDANCGGGPAPCGGIVHCEGAVYAEAVWDLVHRDFMGFDGSPWNLDLNTALELGTRLTYFGSSNVGSWYQCVQGGTGGCNGDGGYLNYLAADDDNGDLTDGTPHMSAIFAAFDRHDIACPTPAVTDFGCAGGPATAPANITATPINEGAQLTWDPVTGASEYWIFRAEGVHGCDFGKALVGTTTSTSFTEIGLRNGFEVLYGVVAVGDSSACTSPMSACEAVTPVEGPGIGFDPSPPVWAGQTGDGDEFFDNCETGTLSFGVINNGVGALTDVRIVEASIPSHPEAEILTSLPSIIIGTLPEGDSATAELLVVGGGFAFGDTLELEVTVTADELDPLTLTHTYTVAALESDLQFEPSLLFSFEDGDDGWQVIEGIFDRTDAPPGGANGTAFYRASSTGLDLQCDLIRSPLLQLTETSTLELFNQFDIEDFSGGFWWDRANMHVFDPLTGERTVVSPDSGRPYNADGTNPAPAPCPSADVPGWASDGPDWVASGWSADALGSPDLAGQLIQLDVAYGTDPAVTGTIGFWFDEVTLTDVFVQVPDAQSDDCGGGGGPIADISPEMFDFTVPVGGSEIQTLNIGNIGDEVLDWAIEEAESALMPETAPYAYGLAAATGFHAPVGSDRASGIRRDRGEAPANRVVLPAPQPAAIGDFTEGFDDITMLPGAGWALINNSEPVGPSSWFQGNGTVFPSHEGEPDAYIAANYESTDDNGTISNWLLTPEVTIVNGTQLCFWTRTTPLFEEFLDRLEVRMSVEGASTDVGETAESVGDFTELLLTIEPDLELPNEYPEEWTEFCLTVRERPRQPATGRFAFRYWVTDSGPDGTNGDYIGIDTVSVTQPDEIPPGDGCANPTDIPWLSATPDTGSTAPGATETSDITVDATDLEIGELTALLCVSTNDPNAPLVEVPVNVMVTEGGAPPVIDVDPDSLESTLPEGGTETQPLTIFNLGDETLEWAVTEDGGGFAGPGGHPRAMASGRARRGGSSLQFSPAEAAAVAAKIRAGKAGGVGVSPSWTDPGLIPGDPDRTVTNTYASLGSLTFYTDRGEFQTANPGLPLEDFGDTNAPPNSVVTCPPPFNSDTNNDCFSPGAILPGLSMDVTVEGGGGQAVVLTPPFLGVPCVSVGPNSFADHGDWDFDPPVRAAGFDLQSDTGGQVFTVTVFGADGPLGSTDVTGAGLGVPVFFGVDTSDGQGITRLEVRGPGTQGELFCDVEFGGDLGPADCVLPEWVSVDPTSGSVPGGGSQIADVTFDAGDLAPGTYEANVCLESNDPVTPLVMVPLTLTVEGAGEPIADITPESFSFEVPEGGSDSDTLNVGNVGTADLVWSITEDEPSSLAAPGVMTHDPALDEPFDLPDFMLDSLANGGEPVSFTVPGGVLTEGDVVGFHFIGTVAGISGSSSWASDMCLMIEAPDGTTYVVGGFSGTSLPGCFNAASEEGNPWDFQGVQSTDDGTYESEHDDVFDPALEDEGDWTLTFVNDWDSTGAATMDWTDVTLTLHKTGDGGGEVCDDVTEIPWLSADPQAGTTAPGGSEPVNVTVDATDLDPGTFEAALCVATNDPNAPVVPVAVTLSVIGGGDDPVIDVDPDSLSSTLPEGGTETHDLTISNLGGGTLEWAVTEESPATGRVVPSIWSPLTPTRDELSAGGPFTAGQRAATGGRAAADAASAVRGRLRSLPVINPANGVVDCDAEPGIIIHDDGTVENGYSGNPTVVSQVIFADRFTPSAYPATFSAVCVAYLTLSGGPGSLDLDIVVFDDDGSGGTPGTELGSMAVTVTDIPVFPNATPVWASFDISSLGIEVTAGSVFIGARWAPPSPTNVFIASDESTTNPPGFAGGYWWNDNANAWAPIQSAFPSYRSLVVRAVEGAGGPSDCTLPSWVSVDPMSGSVPGGESQVAAVTFDATGLPEGEHTANLCIESNDPVTPLVVVPLTLTVTGGGNVACFEAELDGDQETPPVPTDHTGTGVFSYDFDTQELTWEVTHDIDLAEVVGAHIHLGAVGKPGPIVIPMDHTVNPIVGSATLTPDMEMDLTNELYYVNVHTNAYPGGEIRGQILSCDEEPVEGSLTTLFASNNGFAGNTFDIEPFVPLEITGFDVNVAANSDQTITIYWKEGTAAGFDSDPTAWTALGSDVVTPAGQDQPTHAKLGGLQLQPGNVYGFYVDLESYELGVSALRYTNGPPTVFSNDELNHLSLTTLIGKASPAFEGQTFADRMWNGTVYYTLSQAEE